MAVFPSIDRAGRPVRDVVEIDRALRAAGVDTVFLREGVDTSTPTGELFRNIMASLAEFEGRVIYERLSKGKRRKASEGGYTGGWVPYGYRRAEDRTIAVVPAEAAVVERIFRWAAEGRSLPWIAPRLRRRRPRRGTAARGGLRPSRGCSGTASTLGGSSSTAGSSSAGTTPSFRISCLPSATRAAQPRKRPDPHRQKPPILRTARWPCEGAHHGHRQCIR